MRTLIICFLPVLTVGCTDPLKDWPNAQSGIKAAKPAVVAIDAYRNTHGKYPESIDVLGLPENVKKDLRDHKIRYRLRESGSIYNIGFSPRGGTPALCFTGNERKGKWTCAGR